MINVVYDYHKYFLVYRWLFNYYVKQDKEEKAYVCIKKRKNN